MLRTFLIAVGGFCFLCGLVALAAGLFPPAGVFAFWGAVLVLGIVCERVIYKPLAPASPGPGWQRTPERFVDEDTGQMVTVYIEPASGERAYVRE